MSIGKGVTVQIKSPTNRIDSTIIRMGCITGIINLCDMDKKVTNAKPMKNSKKKKLTLNVVVNQATLLFIFYSSPINIP